MPTVTRPASHGANPCYLGSPAPSDSELLRTSWHRHYYLQCESIIQSSFNNIESGSQVYGSANGFVWAAIEAYNHHHHLVIRPEDVWFAILSQLNFFMQLNAEKVRSFFVAHEGRKPLEIRDVGTRENFNGSRMVENMVSFIQKNLVDPSLSEWVMPDFTTTTEIGRAHV